MNSDDRVLTQPGFSPCGRLQNGSHFLQLTDAVMGLGCAI